ncbi:MAG: hypothetical protein U0670_19860 [Anaerolineae bacterium]
MRLLLVLCSIVCVTVGAAFSASAQGKSTPTPTATPTTPVKQSTPSAATPVADAPVAGAMPTLAPDYNAADSSDISSDWERAVEDMRDLGLIDAEGELLFTEDMAIESLGGSGDGESTYRNTVMGALISVREDVPGTVGVCTFITRGQMDRRGNIASAVGVLLTSEDEIYALEQVDPNTEPNMLRVPYEGSAGTLYYPVYVVVLVKDSAVTVWIDGEVILDSWELEGELPDGEYESPVTTTVNPETGCVMTGLWGYGF